MPQKAIIGKMAAILVIALLIAMGFAGVAGLILHGSAQSSCTTRGSYGMCMNPTTQSVGNSVSVNATGLPANSAYDIFVFNDDTQLFANQWACSGTATSSGTLSCSFQVTSAMLQRNGSNSYYGDNVVVTDPPSPGGGAGQVNMIFKATQATTTTTSTSSTTSTNSSTSSTCPAQMALFDGVLTTDSNLYQNNGIRATIQVLPYNVSSLGGISGGGLSAWIDDYLPNGLWAQVGYGLTNNNVYGLYQVWNLSTGRIVSTAETQIAYATQPIGIIRSSFDVFQFSAINSTTWDFSINGNVHNQVNLGVGASISQASHVSVEEQPFCSDNPFNFSATIGNIAFHEIQYFKSGSWHDVLSATSWSNPSSSSLYFGVQGLDQNASVFASDQFIVGTGITTFGTQLWG